MCQKTPQKGTSTPKGRKTGGNVTKARTSAPTTKKRARLRLSPGGNGEGKKSPLRRLPTDHRESLTQTAVQDSRSIYGALATSHKGKSRVDAEADFDRLFICIVGVECGVM